MRVALFSSTIDVTNGYGNITYEYCRELQRQGVNFTLFLPSTEVRLASELNRRFPVKCVLPGYIFRVRPWNILAYFKCLDVSAFDLVHSLFDFPYCFMAARSAKKYGRAFIMGVQGTYGITPLTFWPEKYMMKWAYRQASLVIVPSQFTKDKIKQYGKEDYPIEIIHNGVNFDRFQKPVDVDMVALRAKYEAMKVLITVGGLRNRKGQDLVIRALAIVKDEHPDIKYILVGAGYWRAELESLARALEVDDMVEFIGNKKNDELIAYFKLADIFILTPKVVSDLVFEGFGIVYLEASACKKPIIATDAGGVRDAVRENKTGLIVPDQDVEGIARAINRLLADKELSKQLGQAGYEYAKEHDWPKIVDKFISVYQQYA